MKVKTLLKCWNVPGCPVLKILGFHCRGRVEFNSWVGEQRPHMLHGAVKNDKIITTKKMCQEGLVSGEEP